MTLSGTIINAVVIPMGPRPELIQSGYVTVKDGVISEIGQGAPGMLSRVDSSMHTEAF